MLHVYARARQSHLHKLLCERFANGDDAIGPGQRPAVEPVVEKHLFVGRRVAMIESDPRIFLPEPGNPHQKMRFDLMSHDYVRRSLSHNLAEGANHAPVKASAFRDDIDLNSGVARSPNKLVARRSPPWPPHPSR